MHYLVIAQLVDSATEMVRKFLQQVGCIFVVSLVVKVLVAYVLLPHYILVMEAVNCVHWIRKSSTAC